MGDKKGSLALLTVDELKTLAKEQGLKGYSKLRKEQLVALIADSFHDDACIRNYLNSFNSYEAETFYKMLLDRKLRLTSGNIDLFTLPMNLGYVETTTEEGTGHTILSMEDHFEDLFCEWWDTVGEAHIAQKRVIDYCIACTNLWGIAPVAKVTEVLNAHCGTNLTKAQVLERAKAYAAEDSEDFSVIGDELVSDILIVNNMDGALRSQQGSKPYYVPVHEELLRYTYDTYFPVNEHVKAFGDFMLKNYNHNQDALSELMGEIAFVHRVWDSMAHSLNVLMEYIDGGSYKELSEEELHTLADKMKDMLLNLRTWSNRGYTTEEMKLQNKSAEPSVKQGRNDPCACGSGKKYKKCCGR